MAAKNIKHKPVPQPPVGGCLGEATMATLLIKAALRHPKLSIRNENRHPKLAIGTKRGIQNSLSEQN